MRVRRAAAFALAAGALAVAWVTACGGGSGDGASGSPSGGAEGGAGDDGAVATSGDGALHAAPIPEDQFFGSLVDALCSNIEPCCADQGFDFTRGACASVLQGGGDAGLSGAASGLVSAFAADAGLAYDPQAAGDCIAAYRTYQAACRTPIPNREIGSIAALDVSVTGIFACENVFTGSRGLGEPCTFVDACSPGLVCYALSAPSDGGAPVGRCSRLQIGVAENAHCTVLEDAGTSSELEICGSTSSFDPDANTAAGLLWCEAASQTCKPIQASADGQPCATVFQACGAASYCSAQKICARAAQAGEPCGGANPECVAETACSPDGGRCAALAPLGAPCSTGSDCASHECNAKRVCSSAVPGLANRQLCAGH